MRITRTGRILIGIAVLFTIAAAWVVSSWPPPRNHRLADGTVLRVERVSFGQRDQAFVPYVSTYDELKEKLVGMLPKTWAAKISVRKFTSNGPWWMVTKTHTNVNSVNVWLTLRDRTNGFAALPIGTAELVDDDGYVYPSTQTGGNTRTTASLQSGWPASFVTWFTFEAYPRHQSKMRLRLYSQNSIRTNQVRELLAEFTILNPAPRATTAAGWTLESLPSEKKFGDVSFVLKSVGYKTNWNEAASNAFPWNYSANPVEIVPRFAVFEQGHRTAQWKPTDVGPDMFASQSLVEQPSDWDVLDMELSDSSGNIAPNQWGHPLSRFLSPRESAWKLAVKFFGSEQADAASNTVWIIRGVKVPGPAQYTALPYESNLDGVLLKPIALAGAGKTTYVGDKVLEILPSSSPAGGDAQYTSNPQWQMVNLAMPHISVDLGDFQDDQRLTIRAVTPDGKEYYAQPQSFAYNGSAKDASRIAYFEKSPGYYQLMWYPLDLPADVKTVDLYICIHRATTISFTFKPPPQ